MLIDKKKTLSLISSAVVSRMSQRIKEKQIIEIDKNLKTMFFIRKKQIIFNNNNRKSKLFARKRKC